MQAQVLTIYCDGGARGNPGPAASAFVVLDQQGRVFYKNSKYLGVSTNNVAEYRAVLLAFEWLKKRSEDVQVKKVIFNLDSELVVRQLTGTYKVKSQELLPLVIEIKKLESSLDSEVDYKHVARSKNTLSDSLVNKTLDDRLK